MSLTVTLVRHGQTTKNFEQKIQTRTDALLSELGVLQAELLGQKLAEEQFSRAYSSDKKRAKHTAEHILKYNKNPVPALTFDERLRERDFGDYEDLNVVEIHQKATSLGIRMYKLFAPGGESYEEFAEKGHQFFIELCKELDNMKEDEQENILIITHGGWILSFIDTLVQNVDTFDVENLFVDETIRTPMNTSATKMIIQKRTGTVDTGTKYQITFLSIFDAGHLESLNHTKPV